MRVVKAPRDFRIVTEHRFSKMMEAIKDSELLSPEDNKKLQDKIGHLTDEEARECLAAFLKPSVEARYE